MIFTLIYYLKLKNNAINWINRCNKRNRRKRRKRRKKLSLRKNKLKKRLFKKNNLMKHKLSNKKRRNIGQPQKAPCKKGKGRSQKNLMRCEELDKVMNEGENRRREMKENMFFNC